MTALPTFDLAAGITRTGLDQIAADLYAVPQARQHLFRGSVSKTLSPFGDVDVAYDITQVPTFVLSPPTAAQWQDAQRVDPKQPCPTADALQLVFSAVSGSLTIGTSAPVVASGALTVYAVLDVAGGTASITPVAVYLDESSFSGWDQMIVNGILIPQALQLAAKLLVFAVPSIPAFLGLSFQPVVATIQSDCVLAGTTLDGGGTTQLDGLVPPAFDVFAMCKLHPINQALQNQIDGQTFDEGGQSGPSGWYAAGHVKATDVQMGVGISGGGLVASVSASCSGYGELGGVGVGITKAVLCPVGAAIDAITDPGDWDKVVASFDLKYRPDPLGVSVTVAAGAATADGQPVQLSAGQLSSVQLIYAPTWSGSVTGSVLSTAAAAFIDLVSALFGKLIINEIIQKAGQNRTVYTIPPLAQTLDGVTASLAIGTQPVTVIAPDTLAQGLQLTFS